MVYKELDTIKDMVSTLHSTSMDYFHRHKKKEDNLEEKFDISFVNPNTTQTKDVFGGIGK